MAIDKESPDKDSSGGQDSSGSESSGGGGFGGGSARTSRASDFANTNRSTDPGRQQRTKDSFTRDSGGRDRGPSARKSTASDFTSPNKSVDPNAAAAIETTRTELRDSLLDRRDMDPQAAQKRAIAGLLRQGIVPKLDDTGSIIGADPEQPGKIEYGKYTPGTGAFGATGQYNDPNASMDDLGHLSQYGMTLDSLPNTWGRVGSVVGNFAMPGGGGLLGGMVGNTVDAAAAKSGLLDAGMNPDIAEKIVENQYGKRAFGSMLGAAVGGVAAETGYNLAGQEGALAASTAAKASIDAATDAAFGGAYNAADVAGLSTQTNKITKNDSGDGPWFELVAKQLESPSQAVAGQPPKESTAPAIPTRLNYLEDSLANSAMQYASNANYQPRAVYSSGASSGASGTYYGNAPSSGTVINI